MISTKSTACSSSSARRSAAEVDDQRRPQRSGGTAVYSDGERHPALIVRARVGDPRACSRRRPGRSARGGATGARLDARRSTERPEATPHSLSCVCRSSPRVLLARAGTNSQSHRSPGTTDWIIVGIPRFGLTRCRLSANLGPVLDGAEVSSQAAGYARLRDPCRLQFSFRLVPQSGDPRFVCPDLAHVCYAGH